MEAKKQNVQYIYLHKGVDLVMLTLVSPQLYLDT
jgi:hypothetical protein